MVELRQASKDLLKECGGFNSLYSLKDALPIHPGRMIKFQNCDPEVLKDAALEDMPTKTMSILGDPELNAEICISKFRNLPKVTISAREFRAGEYIDIVDRLWHTPTPQCQYAAGEIETKIYKGATSSQDSGARIIGHRRYLRRTLPGVTQAFSKTDKAVPYHYQFGCQADPSEPAHECRSDFRSMGHVSTVQNESQCA